ncbi:MAG: alpha/beta hydrolase [Acidobacteriota bacterium]
MGKTILLIHGMWGGPHLWDNYRPFFEGRGHRCLTPALRYHGGPPSAPPPPGLGTTSLLDYAADLEGQIRALPERPWIVGHSMGGLLAQILAARGLCEKAVLLCPAAPRGVLALRPSVVRSFLSAMSRWGFWRRPFLPTYGEACYALWENLPEEERRAHFARFIPESGRAAFEIGLWPLDRRRASAVDEKRVTCPLLVVAGGRDRITPEAVVRKVAAKYGAAYRVFPGMAHWVIGEPGWEEVAAFALSWLEGP